MALKYCGGCDPTYDRVAHWERIRNIARERIEWVDLNDGPYEAILLITGCPTACPERDLGGGVDYPLIVVRSDELEPGRVVDILLS